MQAEQFPAHIRALAKDIEHYAMVEWPGMAGKKILRFIDGNFRAQGWQGSTFQKWKGISRKGTILVKTGAGRRAMRQETAAGEVHTWNAKAYMGVHNHGFKGEVSIRSYKRSLYVASKVGTGRFTKTGKERTKTIHTKTGETMVKAHTRMMNITKRQFMPETYQDSIILWNAVKRQTIKDMKNLANKY